MKRKIYGLLSLILAAAMLFTACAGTGTEETTSEEIETITAAPLTNGDSTPEETTTEEEETTTEPATEEKVTYIGTITGYTSKGYVISVKNGITYVNNVLVANKTYALPAGYNPGALLSECERAFNRMKADAASEGLTIWNASGFRSYELQESLYNRYSARDGKAAADRYSARPGHSEHQSGLAIDLNEITNAFKDTREGRWVAANCHKYGFILRYPQGKEAQTGYMYEPWHIRYVGVDTATAIYNSGLCLEEYFGITSAYATPVEEETTEEPTAEITTAAETTAAAEETTATVEETTVTTITENTTEAIVG